MLIPHIQSIFRFAQKTEKVVGIENLVQLLSLGAYHTPQPLSHEHFRYVRSLLNVTSDTYLHVLVHLWEMSHYCEFGHAAYEDGYSPALVSENTLRAIVEGPESHFANYAPFAKVPVVRLAVMIAIHYRHSDSSDRMPILRHETIDPTVSSLVNQWQPSGNLTEVEKKTQALKELFLTLVEHDYTSQSQASTQAERLVHCFSIFRSVSKFCCLLYAALSKFVFTCKYGIVSEVLAELLELEISPPPPFSIWKHLLKPMINVKPRNKNATIVDRIMGALSQIQEHELPGQKLKADTGFDWQKWAKQWDSFREFFRLLLPFKDPECEAVASDFLSSSSDLDFREKRLGYLLNVLENQA